MQNASTLHWTLLVALLASPVGASAQHTTDDQEPVASSPRLLPDVVLGGHTGGVNHAAFSPDGSRIVTTSDDETARLWSDDGKQFAVLVGHTAAVNHAAFSPDGSCVVTTSDDGNAHLWDKAGNPLAVLEGGGENYAEFHPRGNRIVTVSYNGAVRVWWWGQAPAGGSEAKQLAVLVGGALAEWVDIGWRSGPFARGGARHAAFSPDGNRIVTTGGYDGAARLWDAPLVQSAPGDQAPPCCIVFGRHYCWGKVSEGKPLAVLRAYEPEGPPGRGLGVPPRFAEFSRDGSRILADSFNNAARLWDRDGTEIAVLRGHTRGPVMRARFSPDGSRIVTASRDKTARLWDSKGKQLAILVGHTSVVLFAAFSPDGSRIVTTSDDGTARLWDSEGKGLAVLVGGGGFHAEFSPDGSRIVTASDDNTALVYRVPPSPAVTTASQVVAQERATTLRDASEFRVLHNSVISADGAWMAAEEHPDQGDGNVRAWSTEGDVTFSIERGQDPRISRDSRWISALQSPLEDAGTAEPTNHRTGQTLVLLDLQDGSQKTFDFVLSYDMTYASTYLLYLQSPETRADKEGPSKNEATKPAGRGRRMGTLHQIPLNESRLARTLRPYVPGTTYAKKNVVEFAAHPTSDHFAYVWHDKETGGETLHIVKWGIRASYHGEKIEGLCWAGGADGGDDSIILGFLNSTETTGEDGKRRVNSALYTWQPAQTSEEQFTRVDTPQ